MNIKIISTEKKTAISSFAFIFSPTCLKAKFRRTKKCILDPGFGQVG